MKILPVIHYLNFDLALGQVDLARSCGADGVFLIGHHHADDEVAHAAVEAKKRYPDFPVGINLLFSDPYFACVVAKNAGLDMVWADDMGVSSEATLPRANQLSEFARANPAISLFASVAFKYQKHEPDPALAATNATALGFIPTTSGPGTGKAASVEKIAMMGAATASQLALASGVTPENVSTFAPHVSHILVATGICANEYEIDPERLKLLVDNARIANYPCRRSFATVAQGDAHA